jgi:SM-20-related protein
MKAPSEDCLDYALLEAAPLVEQPFAYFVAQGVIRPSRLPRVLADFPDVPGPGSHPPSQLAIQGAFADLLHELDGVRFRAIVEDKFGLSLEGLPTMYTVRGYVRRGDGAIHTDSRTKVITILVYLNEEWSAEGGQLRLLRNGHDLEDYVAEVPPRAGTILAFRRSDNSWHGHHPFEGRRRAIQMNWVVDPDVVRREQRRHAFSTRLKKVQNAFQPWR